MRHAAPIALVLLGLVLTSDASGVFAEEEIAPGDGVVVLLHDIADLVAATHRSGEELLAETKTALPGMDLRLIGGTHLVAKATLRQQERLHRFLEDWRTRIRGSATEREDAELELTYHDVHDLASRLGATVQEIAGRVSEGVPGAKVETRGHAVLVVTGTAAEQRSATAVLQRLRESRAAGGPTVSFAFRDEDVRDVIRTIAEFVKANVIVSPDVQGTVSLSLHDVPWRTALDAAAESVGAVVIEEDHGIFRVHTARPEPGGGSEAMTSPLDAKTVFLQVDDAPVEQILSSLGDQTGIPVRTTSGAVALLEGKRATLVFVHAQAQNVLDHVASLFGLRWRHDPGVGVVFFTPEEGGRDYLVVRRRPIAPADEPLSSPPSILDTLVVDLRVWDVEILELLHRLRARSGLACRTTDAAARRLGGKRASMEFRLAPVRHVLDAIASLGGLTWRLDDTDTIVFSTPEERQGEQKAIGAGAKTPRPPVDTDPDVGAALRLLLEEIRALRAEVEEVRSLLEAKSR